MGLRVWGLGQSWSEQLGFQQPTYNGHAHVSRVGQVPLGPSSLFKVGSKPSTLRCKLPHPTKQNKIQPHKHKRKHVCKSRATAQKGLTNLFLRRALPGPPKGNVFCFCWCACVCPHVPAQGSALGPGLRFSGSRRKVRMCGELPSSIIFWLQ